MLQRIWTFLFCLLVLPFFSWAQLGTILNPALSHKLTNDSGDSWIHGTIKTRFTRNLRVSGDNFLNSYYSNGWADTLYFDSDISLYYSLDRVSPSFRFNPVQVFASFSYTRPVYSSKQSIKESCWNPVLCFGDLHLGFSKPIKKTGIFSSEASLYFVIPISSSSYKSSLMTGIGSSLVNFYGFFSRLGLRLSLISNHSLQLDWHRYKTANKLGTDYNNFLNIFNQLGVRLSYFEWPLVPDVFFYGSYRFLVNRIGTLFHVAYLGASTGWKLSQKMRLTFSLNWGDHLLRSHSMAQKIGVFSPDRTFLGLGASYAF